MYLVKHTSFETCFQVREIRPGPACHIGVIDVCDILRDRWHGGPWLAMAGDECFVPQSWVDVMGGTHQLSQQTCW